MKTNKIRSRSCGSCCSKLLDAAASRRWLPPAQPHATHALEYKRHTTSNITTRHYARQFHEARNERIIHTYIHYALFQIPLSSNRKWPRSCTQQQQQTSQIDHEYNAPPTSHHPSAIVTANVHKLHLCHSCYSRYAMHHYYAILWYRWDTIERTRVHHGTQTRTVHTLRTRILSAHLIANRPDAGIGACSSSAHLLATRPLLACARRVMPCRRGKLVSWRSYVEIPMVLCIWNPVSSTMLTLARACYLKRFRIVCVLMAPRCVFVHTARIWPVLRVLQITACHTSHRGH